MQRKHNIDPENIVFYKTGCFLIYDSPEFKEYPMHWHNAVEILMPTENIFPVACSNTEYVLEENQVLIIPPGELHNLKAQNGRRIIMLCDNAMLEGNPALKELSTVLSEPVWINSDYDDYFVSELKDIILDMVKIFDEAPDFCETLLYQKLIAILLKVAEYKRHVKNKNSDKTEFLKKYIDSFYMNPITLDTLAENVGYSKFHLSRLLNSSGISFSDMLNMRRIKAAEIMLRDDNFTVTQAALNSGFTSITTFNRVFRKIKGCTPTKFRKMYRENNV